MKRSLLLTALLTGALLLGYSAAAAEPTQVEELASALNLKARAITGKSKAERKRARALSTLAHRITLIEQKKMPVDHAGRDGSTTLMLAVVLNEAEAARYLLQQGASPECRNAKGKNALSLAKSPDMKALLSSPLPEPSTEEPAPAETEDAPAEPEPATAPTE